MTPRQQHTVLAALVFSLALSGCAKTAAGGSDSAELKAANTGKATSMAHVSHPKTGAAVTLDSSQSYAVAAGEVGDVQIVISEDYRAGTMTLEARDGDGIEIFGANRIHTIDLGTGTQHDWTLQFSAASDGVYYIPVVANAAPENALSMSRALSVRVEVGDAAATASKTTQGTRIEQMTDGETVVVMSAEETIK